MYFSNKKFLIIFMYPYFLKTYQSLKQTCTYAYEFDEHIFYVFCFVFLLFGCTNVPFTIRPSDFLILMWKYIYELAD